MNTWGKFVLSVVVGAVIVTGIIATCSDRLTVGEATAWDCMDTDCKPKWQESSSSDLYECDVNKTCVRWAYGWHQQHQRVRNEVTTVEVRGWKCVGWEFPKGGLIPACDNEIMTREAGR